jgi:hypothetical protein
MIDVNDLGQIVWPVCLAMRVILTRPPRWRLATRQDGSNRGEEIAPVKAGREVLRLPVDVPSARVLSWLINGGGIRSGAAVDGQLFTAYRFSFSTIRS